MVFFSRSARSPSVGCWSHTQKKWTVCKFKFWCYSVFNIVRFHSSFWLSRLWESWNMWIWIENVRENPTFEIDRVSKDFVNEENTPQKKEKQSKRWVFFMHVLEKNGIPFNVRIERDRNRKTVRNQDTLKQMKRQLKRKREIKWQCA